MSRPLRLEFPDALYHSTTRGDRREDIHDNDSDRDDFLAIFGSVISQFNFVYYAYCLMTNPIRPVALPKTESGLQSVLKPLHMRYGQRFNRQRNWKGHVWRGRYFSSPLDEQYLWAAMRYVERNPVRARMVRKAENYAWCSAKSHCTGIPDSVLPMIINRMSPDHNMNKLYAQLFILR